MVSVAATVQLPEVVVLDDELLLDELDELELDELEEDAAVVEDVPPPPPHAARTPPAPAPASRARVRRLAIRRLRSWARLGESGWSECSGWSDMRASSYLMGRHGGHVDRLDRTCWG